MNFLKQKLLDFPIKKSQLNTPSLLQKTPIIFRDQTLYKKRTKPIAEQHRTRLTAYFPLDKPTHHTL